MTEPKTDPIRIVIADPSPLFRQGVRMLLRQVDYPLLLIEAADIDGLRAAVEGPRRRSTLGQRGIHLVIVDRSLPGLNRFDQLTGLLAGRPPRLLMTAEILDAGFLREAYRQSIDGVIDKRATPELFLEAVTAVYKGLSWYANNPQESDVESEPSLSRKQSLVLERLKAGMSNKQIAADLQISENTVKYHVTQMYRRLNIPNPNRVLLALSA